MKTITPIQLQTILAAQPSSPVIDVRTPVEFAEVHVPQARSVPLDELKPSSLQLQKDQPVYLLCRSGQRATKAAEKFAKEGFTSVCHRRTAAGLEFAIVEGLPLKSGEKKDILNSGLDAREVLQAFTRDQRQVLNLWKEDVKAQVREHLDEKYPRQDMGIVVESFEIKMARDIARRETLAQNRGHGIRI